MSPTTQRVEPASSSSQITTSVDGIGHVLSDGLLEIPDYQRSYSWQEDEVSELWLDIERAMTGGSVEYFLGSIVTTSTNAARQQVIDGQQRLATVCLLFAAMRDILQARSDERAGEIERDFLGRKNMMTREWESKLRLSAEDNPVFQSLLSGKQDDGSIKATHDSHKLLLGAYKYLHSKLQALVDGLGADAWQKPLVEWHDYLISSAKVIVVNVANESRAFIIFETLNDRGLNLSTADLLKGHLFGVSGDRIEECKAAWARVMAAFVGEDAAITDVFLRHYWSSREGVSRVKALFSQMRDKIDSRDESIRLAVDLADAAPMWTSMFERDAEYWKPFSDKAKSAIEVLGSLKVEQCRPLVLAAMRRFSTAEMAKLLSLLVCWSIRWFVVGGGGAGVTERLYAETAKKITDGTICTADQVTGEIVARVPNDRDFESIFATQSVRRGWLARYYLLALEMQALDSAEPELVPNADRDEVNLEHVLARNAVREDWPMFSDEQFAEMKLLLGNQVLLKASSNSEIGNGSFASKREASTRHRCSSRTRSARCLIGHRSRFDRGRRIWRSSLSWLGLAVPSAERDWRRPQRSKARRPARAERATLIS